MLGNLKITVEDNQHFTQSSRLNAGFKNETVERRKLFFPLGDRLFKGQTRLKIISNLLHQLLHSGRGGVPSQLAKPLLKRDAGFGKRSQLLVEQQKFILPDAGRNFGLRAQLNLLNGKIHFLKHRPGFCGAGRFKSSFHQASMFCKCLVAKEGHRVFLSRRSWIFPAANTLNLLSGCQPLFN